MKNFTWTTNRFLAGIMIGLVVGLSAGSLISGCAVKQQVQNLHHRVSAIEQEKKGTLNHAVNFVTSLIEEKK